MHLQETWWMDGWTTDWLWYKVLYPFFLKKKASIIRDKIIMHIYLEACNIICYKHSIFFAHWIFTLILPMLSYPGNQIKMTSSCYVTSQHIFSWTSGNLFKKYKFGIEWLARKRIHYLYGDGIEKSAPQDHGLSSLGKPRDLKRWSSGRIFLSHDRFL